MPISAFQQEVLRLLAQQRSPDSFVAGATVINATPDSPRFSKDIDINHDLQEAVMQSATQDAHALQANGFAVRWLIQQPTFVRAMAERGKDRVKLEWVFDSAFRFFPVEPDAQCGWRLNLYDAATNKVLAMAGRLQARDFVDVIYLHERLLSFGALCWAASGKDLGMNPQFIVEEARRTAHYTAADFGGIIPRQPLDVPRLYATWRQALDQAASLIALLPPADLGCLYLDDQNRVVNPDPKSPEFPKLRRHFGSVRGAWPVIRS